MSITKTAKQELHRQMYKDLGLNKKYQGGDDEAHAEKLHAYLQAHQDYKRNNSKLKRYGPGVAANLGGGALVGGSLLGGGVHILKKMESNSLTEDQLKELVKRTGKAMIPGVAVGAGLGAYSTYKAMQGLRDGYRRRKSENQLAEIIRNRENAHN